MPRILSGIQPSGRLHLGNLLGAVNNWVNLQSKYESYFEIADIHALTTGYLNAADLKENTLNLALDLIAAGLDPQLCTIFVQSAVPEHSELHLLLSMITPLSWLERVPTYKSKIMELKEIDLGTYGFLGYPLLQAADILIYKADLVPVGLDQLPHLELTREIARRFNGIYKNIFPEPKDLLTDFAVIPGIDGRKMSKSYGNIIAISDSADETRKKINLMITDPQRIKKNDPGHPDICNIFAYHKIYSTGEIVKIMDDCKQGAIGCVECKNSLADKLNESLKDIRQKRLELQNNPSALNDILSEGAGKASKIAKETLRQVKQAMGLY